MRRLVLALAIIFLFPISSYPKDLSLFSNGVDWIRAKDYDQSKYVRFWLKDQIGTPEETGTTTVTWNSWALDIQICVDERYEDPLNRRDHLGGVISRCADEMVKIERAD
jgi:hypothetical protein